MDVLDKQIMDIKLRVYQSKMRLRTLPLAPDGKRYNTLDMSIRKMKQQLKPLMAERRVLRRRAKKAIATRDVFTIMQEMANVKNR